MGAIERCAAPCIFVWQVRPRRYFWTALQGLLFLERRCGNKGCKSRSTTAPQLDPKQGVSQLESFDALATHKLSICVPAWTTKSGS